MLLLRLTAVLVSIAAVPGCGGGTTSEGDARASEGDARAENDAETTPTGQLCACAAGAKCQNDGPKPYSAVCTTSWDCPTWSSSCDYKGWIGDLLFVGDAHYGSCFSTEPCPPTEVVAGSNCLNLGLVCAYASTGCDSDRRWYACEEGLDHGEWQPVSGLCPMLCPDVVPKNGTPCSAESMYCHSQSECGAADEAVCLNGAWSVILNPCVCADPNRYNPGDACTAPGVVCQEGNNRNVQTSVCEGGQWTVVEGDASCPVQEPSASEPCAEGNSCAWMDVCGARITGRCTGGVWTKSIDTCRTGLPPRPCGPGEACEPRTTCVSCGNSRLLCTCGPDGTYQCEYYCGCSTCPL